MSDAIDRLHRQYVKDTIAGQVLVGPRPRLIRAEGRWGEPTNYWYVPEAGYIDPDDWRRVQAFQEPMGTEVGTKGLHPSVREYERTRLAMAVKRKVDLNPQHSTLWEFNVLRAAGDWLRLVAVCGTERHAYPIIEWGWRERLTAWALRQVAWKRNRWRRPAPEGWE